MYAGLWSAISFRSIVTKTYTACVVCPSWFDSPLPRNAWYARYIWELPSIRKSVARDMRLTAGSAVAGAGAERAASTKDIIRLDAFAGFSPCVGAALAAAPPAAEA